MSVARGRERWLLAVPLATGMLLYTWACGGPAAALRAAERAAWRGWYAVRVVSLR